MISSRYNEWVCLNAEISMAIIKNFRQVAVTERQVTSHNSTLLDKQAFKTTSQQLHNNSTTSHL